MDKENFTIREITEFHEEDLKDINNLLLQWSSRGYQMKPDYFKSLIKNSHVMALYNGKRIVGTVTLIKMHKLSGVKGSVEHLIVDEKYRGKGLGKKLMMHAIKLAEKLKIETLFLTCEPKRIVANALYKKLGFNIKETNFYQKNLN